MARLFDFYQYKRVAKEFTDPTTLGAILSFCGVCLFVYLGLSETVSFLTVRATETITLAEPHTRGALLPMRFNITFPRVPCALLSIATFDALGSNVINVSSSSQVHFYKWSASGDLSLARSGMGEDEFNGRALEEETVAAPLGLLLPEGGSGATPLTTATFEAFVKERKLAFVTFGAPWW